MMNILIGRKREQKVLEKIIVSPKAEMVAVIGRRRVGKTYLINTFYREKIVFQLTGTQNAPEAEQLENFSISLGLEKVPTSWNRAFYALQSFLEELDLSDKKVIFFDELPWLATPESSFLRALGYFWNSWAARQNLVVVICGSASSWIIQKVINNKGGLHNRVTHYLHLKPFTLAETEAFLKVRNRNFTHYQITQLYMTLGGIPLYLEAVEGGKSAAQNIDQICFSETGILKNEFSRLYPSLFENAHYHIEIVRALATKRSGMTRNEIIAKSKALNGGKTTQVLEELEQSDFIMAFHPFGKKKKGKLYRLIDEYSLFYLQFMENRTYEGSGTWLQLSQTQEYKIWSGYAYEGICMKHIPQIKQAMGIGKVYTTTYSYYKKATETEKGLQIDLLLERADQVINLFEIKFYNTELVLSKSQASSLQERLHRFIRLSKTKKQVFITLITSFGLEKNKHSIGLVDETLTLEDLFAVDKFS